MPSRAAEQELRRQFSLPYSGSREAVNLAEIERRMKKARKWCSRRTAGTLNWQLLIERDKMPPPISRIGAPTWERNGWEAWFSRAHPDKPKHAANDQAPLPPRAADDWDRALAAEYGNKETA